MEPKWKEKAMRNKVLRKVTTIAAAALLAALVAVMMVLWGARPAEATFTGTNGKIAFHSAMTTGTGVDNPEGDFEIFSIDPDGSNLTQLTVNGPDAVLGNLGSDLQPAWSPDGTQIAFTSTRDRNVSEDFNFNVYKMLADGSSQLRLTKNLANDQAPTWSPGGTKVAFQSDRNGNWEIYTMKAKPEGRRNRPVNLTKDAASMDVRPTWSPNGKMIAYSGMEGSNREIFTKPVGGGARTNITNDEGWNLFSDFSPDGKWIVYDDGGEGGEIRVSPSTGGDPVTLTSEGIFPAFSPDGSQIIYLWWNDEGKPTYFTVTFTVNDGIPSVGTPTEVPNTGVDGGPPKWQPIVP
jgi:Tol biopolymer transport system component